MRREGLSSDDGGVFGDIKDKVITVLVEWITQDHTSYLSQTPQTLSVEQQISSFLLHMTKLVLCGAILTCGAMTNCSTDVMWSINAP